MVLSEALGYLYLREIVINLKPTTQEDEFCV